MGRELEAGVAGADGVAAVAGDGRTSGVMGRKSFGVVVVGTAAGATVVAGVGFFLDFLEDAVLLLVAEAAAVLVVSASAAAYVFTSRCHRLHAPRWAGHPARWQPAPRLGARAPTVRAGGVGAIGRGAALAPPLKN